MARPDFKPGAAVYSKRCGRVPGFDGLIVDRRGNGFQVLNPATGITYQRDLWDLIALDQSKKRVLADAS